LGFEQTGQAESETFHALLRASMLAIRSMIAVNVAPLIATISLHVADIEEDLAVLRQRDAGRHVRTPFPRSPPLSPEPRAQAPTRGRLVFISRELNEPALRSRSSSVWARTLCLEFSYAPERALSCSACPTTVGAHPRRAAADAADGRSDTP